MMRRINIFLLIFLMVGYVSIIPYAAAVSRGDIVVDAVNTSVTSNIVSINPGTGTQSTLLSPGTIGYPNGITVDTDGNIFVTSVTTDSVYKIDSVSGGVSTVSSGGNFRSLYGIAIEANGQLVVVDGDIAQWGGVIRINPTIADDGMGGNQTVLSTGIIFNDPEGITVAQNGDLYVVSQAGDKILRVNPMSGSATTVSSNGLLTSPRHVAVEADGKLVITDPSGIIRVDPSLADDGLGGNQTLLSSGGALSRTYGIAVETDGKIIVADNGSFGSTIARILRIDPAIPDDTQGGNQTVLSSGGALTSLSGVAIVPDSPPDFTSTLDCATLPPLITPSTTSFTWNLHLSGDAGDSTSSAAVYLSDDNVLDPSVDTRIGENTDIPALSSGDTRTITTSISIPTINPGDYTIFVCADSDNDIAESDENNNCSSCLLTIEAPPVPPDITAALDCGSLPSPLLASSTTSLTWDLHLSGDAVSSSTTAAIYLSQNSIINPSVDTRIGQSTGIPPLSSGETRSITTSISIPPIVAGNYTVYICADSNNEVSEQDETNNCTTVCPVTIDVNPALPALVPSIDCASLSTANVGSPYSFDWSIENNGGSPSGDPIAYEIILSADAVPSSDDVRVVDTQGNITSPALTPGNTRSLTSTFGFPAVPSGYLIVSTVPDPANPESDYTDNTASCPISTVGLPGILINGITPDKGSTDTATNVTIYGINIPDSTHINSIRLNDPASTLLTGSPNVQFGSIINGLSVPAGIAPGCYDLVLTIDGIAYNSSPIKFCVGHEVVFVLGSRIDLPDSYEMQPFIRVVPTDTGRPGEWIPIPHDSWTFEIDDQNRIWVAGLNGQVSIIDFDGNIIASTPPPVPPDNFPVGVIPFWIARGPDGAMWIASIGAGVGVVEQRVYKLEFVESTGSITIHPSEVISGLPARVAVDSLGNSWVYSNRLDSEPPGVLSKLSPTGVVTNNADIDVPYSNISVVFGAMGVDAQDNVWGLSDWQTPPSWWPATEILRRSLVKYQSTGGNTPEAFYPFDDEGMLSDLATTSQNSLPYVWTVNPRYGNVSKFNQSALLIGQFNSANLPVKPRRDFPIAVDIDRLGNAWVANIFSIGLLNSGDIWVEGTLSEIDRDLAGVAEIFNVFLEDPPVLFLPTDLHVLIDYTGRYMQQNSLTSRRKVSKSHIRISLAPSYGEQMEKDLNILLRSNDMKERNISAKNLDSWLEALSAVPILSIKNVNVAREEIAATISMQAISESDLKATRAIVNTLRVERPISLPTFPITIGLGNRQRVKLPVGVSIEFNRIKKPGEVKMNRYGEIPDLPVGFKLGWPGIVYRGSTSAVHDGDMTIRFKYIPSSFSGSEKDIRILHREGKSWIDRTTGIDIDMNEITARVGNLGDFVLVQRISGAVDNEDKTEVIYYSIILIVGVLVSLILWVMLKRKKLNNS